MILYFKYGNGEKIDFNIIDTEISDELGQYLKSGVGVPFSIKGKGIIGLQSKVKYSIELYY